MSGGAAFETADDLKVFLDEGEFAVEALWKPQEGAPGLLSGIFTNVFREDDLVDIGVATSEPRFRCRACDVGNVREGDELVIPGSGDGGPEGRKAWRVRGPEPDGTGFIKLMLSEV